MASVSIIGRVFLILFQLVWVVVSTTAIYFLSMPARLILRVDQTNAD